METADKDAALLKRIQKGDLSAFDQLYEGYWELMYASAYARLKTTDLAQDAVQDVFVDLWRRRKTLKVKGEVKVYLLTAVKYAVFKSLDRMNMESVELKESHFKEEMDTILDFEEIYHQIEIALSKLPENTQLIFKMVKIEGLTAEEVALNMDIAPQSVHNSVHKTMKILRKELRDHAEVLLVIFCI
ncbi:RNA polymerase sigma factor [Pararhodonellum marinum]|uniref:RNA polymerase sigma factor n=1 Tax=Pararhodonellum marinum TaxID=2755358 RepID=UPI00188E0A4B|nr:sigma-70 family RNA polymerase sigma factor [Pararhodonellum marinum]